VVCKIGSAGTGEANKKAGLQAGIPKWLFVLAHCRGIGLDDL